ncbi:MAG TPA: type VI secretion system tip protein TssI/VgrG [Sandaracinaceae bacterium LLY-WYZ-13_1]|nr:type VI secretion system tip protein TssI/VgrG [Sandaracinaceae bacterium LLY-WYZ-13_1]
MAEQTYIRAFMDTAACSGMPQVLAVRGREALSHPFRYEIDLEADDLDLDSAVGTNAYVVVSDERSNERHVHGVISRVALAGTPTPERLRVRVELRPPQHRLVHRHGFRIFQELSVPDIVRQVFADAGLPEELFRWDVEGSYETRPYCVQYDESEWDFVNRLLEDEGIWYAFEHAADAVIMVFGDASDRVEALDAGTLRFTFGEREQHALGGGRVFGWQQRRRLVEGKVTLRDYDGLRPSLDLTAEAEADEPHAREHYEYPGGYEVLAEGTRRAAARLEALASRRRVARAQTDHLAVQPGRRFELLDHPSVSGELVVTAVELDFVFHPSTSTAMPLSLPEGRPHRVRFECVPRDQRFRPARRTPTPRVAGVQTARVTGPSGEEIHCDEHGRVKVQFHWDLDGQLDERTTCWIRPTQEHTTGSVMIPRIGWEVLVQFYEGDPDRPVVLGHLFNPLHVPAYALPAQKTVTGHRSVSSPGAGAINEVMFDDASGAQQIAINAGKDLTIHAVNDKTMQTANVMTRQVGAKRTFSVGADQTLSLQANHDAGVGGDHEVTIGGNRTVRVSGNAADEVAASTTIDVGGLENMMIGNPMDAVLNIIASEAIAAAEGAAASAADRVQGALLAPIQPALDGVQGALGEAQSYAGPANAILGADNPAVALYGDTLDGISEATTPPDLAGAAGGMASAVATDAFAAAGVDAGGGGGGGSGVWGTVVAGDMSESVGALGAINSAYGVTWSVGGSSTETVGAARAELVQGGHSESCASKTETVGVYFVNAAGGFGVEADGAIALNTASSKWTLGKGYAATASGACAVTAASIDLNASETVTLKCGGGEVIVDKGGITFKGNIDVTVEASTIEMEPPAIGPG